MRNKAHRAAVRRLLLRAAAFALSALFLPSAAPGEAVPCLSLADMYLAGRDAEERLAGEVHLSLPEEVLMIPHRIHEDKGTAGAWDRDDAVWNMIYLFPSVYKMSYSVYPREGQIRADLYFYYRDGVRLLRCIRDGTEDSLTETEAAALAASRGIAASLPGGLPPRRRLLALSEELCRALTFLAPRAAGDTDVKSCLAALTLGQANCQGYADAFYLTASLAGFAVRFQNGWNLAGESHTWNRVLIDGEWLDLDLTWMDAGDTVNEKYFLMDADALAEGHIPEESAWPGLGEQ